jgi:hypothetical protein
VMLAGLGAAAALALLLAQLDQSVNDVGQLREIGVPVLGGISAFQPAQRRRTIYLQGVTVLTAVVMLVALYGGIAIHHALFGKGLL